VTVRIPRYIVAAAIVAAAGLLTLTLQAFGVWGDRPAVDRILNGWLTIALQFLAAAIIGARALAMRRDRTAWMALTVAVGLYATGMLLYARYESPPFPSLADPFWLSFYPLALVAFALLIRSRVRWRRAGPLLDGLIGALAAATVFAALIFSPVLETLGGERLAVATNLAYPVLDLLILACVVGHLSLSEWRLTPRWLLLSVGLGVFTAADGVYTFAVAKGNLSLGAFVNTGYTAGLLMVAFAAWLSAREGDAPGQRWEELRAVIPSIVLASAAVAVLVTDHYIHLAGGAVWLAGATLAVALFRTGLSFRENLRLLDARKQSLHDELTGLANRRSLLRSLSDAIDAARPGGHSVALLLIDLDRFKDVNDSLGHHVGDELLRVVAGRLTDTLRGDELIARLGGDEFCVVLHHPESAARAEIVAQRVLDALSRPAVLEGMRIDVGASIGVSLFPVHGDSPAELLRSSDIAMYQAKTNGGSGQALYEPGTHSDDVTRLALVGDFRDAIDRNEIEVHYQPRFDTAAGRLTSVEALVRWRHPELGLLGPDAFLPGIERSALIVPLTEHVLATALRDAASWLVDQPDLAVAVNLSARLLHSADLTTTVRNALADAGVPPHCLELEITETMVMANPQRANELLTELSAMGVRIAVDDFGVGHASLSYLTDLPVSILKIDRSFIGRMGRSDRDSAVVAAILSLSEQLGMVSVAEGIEEESTLEQLTSMGCDEVQGYLLARPVPAREIDALVTGRPWGNREHMATPTA
jgi:diguanylate cyclase (GGDEF)-like protein